MAMDPDLQLWMNKASQLGTVDNPLRVPFHIGLKEFAIAAGFLHEHWKPSGDLPGLERVANKLPLAAADEVVSLTRAVSAANTQLLLIVDPKVIDLGDEAREIIDALESPIEFLLDDDVHEPADDQLAALKGFDADAGQSSAALAQSLGSYAALAEELQPRLVEVDTAFDPALITKARALAKTLLDKPAQPSPQSSEAQAARLLRNQLLVLVMERVNSVRKAARHVYRHHPEVLRQVTSAYQRRKRAELRATEKAADTQQPVS